MPCDEATAERFASNLMIGALVRSFGRPSRFENIVWLTAPGGSLYHICSSVACAIPSGRRGPAGRTVPETANRAGAQPSSGAFVPCPGEGVHEDTTNNIFVGWQSEPLSLMTANTTRSPPPRRQTARRPFSLECACSVEYGRIWASFDKRLVKNDPYCSSMAFLNSHDNPA